MSSFRTQMHSTDLSSFPNVACMLVCDCNVPSHEKHIIYVINNTQVLDLNLMDPCCNYKNTHAK